MENEAYNVTRLRQDLDRLTEQIRSLVTRISALEDKIKRKDLGLTVKTVDGTVSVTPTTVIAFNQANGFVLTNTVAGVVEVSKP